jgi:site-specific recombinase XerC
MTKNSARPSKTDTGEKSCEGLYKNLEAQLAKVWREAVKAKSKGMSKESHFRYRNSMPVFLRFCAEKFHLQKLANVGKKHLRTYVDYRRQAGISEKTLKNDLTAIRFFHQFTGSRNMLPDNRELGIRRTPRGGRDRTWTPEEYRRMMDKAIELGRQDVALAMRQALLAGLRIHECTRLTAGQVQDALKDGKLETIGKGGRVRRIPVSPELRLELERILKEHGGTRESKILVEPGQKTHQEIKSIQRFIRNHRSEFTDRAITLHGLRHVYARETFERYAGGSTGERELRAAKARTSLNLGHGRPEVTNIYLHGGK